MANVTQTIHSLTQGISQQPDEQKIPGQVTDMENALPNITQGLLKRPAGEFVGSLTGATTTGRWFHYYRDEAEQYIGQVAKDGTVRMWDCLTGNSKTVVDVTTGSGAAKYLYHDGVDSSEEDIQTLTLNDFTYLNNRTKTVEMDTTTEPDTNFKKEMYVELKSISYSKQYALNLFSDTTSTPVTTATRIKVEKTDTDETDTCPHVATEIFDVKAFRLSAGGVVPITGSFTDSVWSTADGVYSNVTHSINNSGTVPVLSAIPEEKLTLNKLAAFNNDHASDTQETNNTLDSGTQNEEYFLENTGSGHHANGVDSQFTKYFKLKNTATGDTLISEQVTGSTGNHGTDNIYSDVVNAIKNANTAHVIPTYTNSGTPNYSAAGYTTKKYSELPFTIEHTSGSNTVTLKYKNPTAITAGQWVLTRCNAPTGSLASGRPTTTHPSSASDPTWEEYGRDRPFQLYVESTDGSYSGLKSTLVRQGGSLSNGIVEDLYFRLATTGQSVPTGPSDDITYKCRYTTTYDLLFGGSGWNAGDTFTISMKSGSLYTVTIEKISTSQVQANLAKARPQPTPFDTKTTITAQSILGDLRTAIIADGNITANNIEIIGSGLYIKHTVKFNGSTPVGELLNVVAGKVSDVGDLPTQCKHGMVVEVVNSAAEEDNYYVKFEGNNDRDGEGIWAECAQPGRKIELKKSTMPVALIRTADGNFRLTELDGSTYSIGGVTQPVVPKWDDASVGDSVTNPEPSFVGKQINKLLFFRNRFAILADEFIVLSRAGDFTNFFAKSAIQLIASDPIDISSSSDTPATLYDGIEINTGLILFTRTQQFMLTTDSDAFTPLTAKINALSSYNFNYTTNPISMGTTIAFLDNAGKYSRFWEMTRIQREGEPQVIEQSAVVNKLFNKELKYISNSKENSIIFFSEKGTQVLYGFRYFDQVFERKLASWFKWTFTGSIQYHCMQDDALYVVNMINGVQHLQKFSIKKETETPFVYYFKSDSSAGLTFNRETEYLLHLDNLTKVSTKSSAPTGYTGITASYNSSNDKTTLSNLPSSFTTGYNFAAYDPDVSLQMGKYAPNLVKYINIKGIDTYAVNNETIFYSANHGLSQGDLVVYEPIGEQSLQVGNTVIPNGYVFRVITNGNFSATSQFKLSSNDTQTAENVGLPFTVVGNDQQVLKVHTLGGVTPYGTGLNKFYLDGNWTNQDFLIGYDFTMKVKLPTFYYSTKDGENFRSDSSANTIIHRIKMGFGPVGRYKAIVNSNFPTLDNETGLLYEEEFETLAVLNQSTQIEDDVQQRVIPFYQKNKNATLTIESTHPTPATIHNLTWEGVYTPPYYTRV